MTEVKKKRTRLKPNDKHYVSNKEFLQDFITYREKMLPIRSEHWPEWPKETETFKKADWYKVKPRLSDAIGKKIMLIANRVAFKPNFINYSFRDEMIDDAIENCIMYADNFDPDKSSNPFAYFTQICHFAFIRRIQREKKQFMTKVKYVQQSASIVTELTTQGHDAGNGYSNNYRDFLRGFYDIELDEEKEKKPRKKRSTNKSSTEDLSAMIDAD